MTRRSKGRTIIDRADVSQNLRGQVEKGAAEEFEVRRLVDIEPPDRAPPGGYPMLHAESLERDVRQFHPDDWVAPVAQPKEVQALTA